MISPSPLHLLWRVPAVGALGVAILFSGLSTLLLEQYPDRAAWFNPFRTDARIDTAISGLTAIPAVADPEARAQQTSDMEAFVRRTLALAPGDARAYSAVGAVEGLKGDRALADRYYDAALVHARTEIFALSNRMSKEYAAGDYGAALDDADIILRRWTRYRDNLVPALVQMTAAAGFGDALTERLLADPPWRPWLVQKMAGNTAGLSFLEHLLLEESGQDRPLPKAQIAAVVNGFLAAKDYARAYRLFVMTLDAPGRAVSGLVHDDNFEQGFGSTFFQWTFWRIPTADITMRPGPQDDGWSGIRVRFLDSPTTLGNLVQYTIMPAGPYTVTADVTAERLVLPRGLFWSVRCAGTAAILGRIPIEEGSYRHASPSAAFTVPPDCPAQMLQLETDQQVESFHQQYKGSVVFGRVWIEARTAGGTN